MKSQQNKIIDQWRLKGLDIMDTSKMHRMADEAVHVMNTQNSDYVISWWATALFVLIGTIIAWTLIYISLN